MDPIGDWYRYVDRVSRPSRRNSVESTEANAPAWRPWLDVPEEEPADDALRADEVPDLALSLGPVGLEDACQPATLEFEDLTVHDELHPMREFPVPELRPPVFEVDIPTLGAWNPLAPPVELVAEGVEAPADEQTWSPFDEPADGGDLLGAGDALALAGPRFVADADEAPVQVEAGYAGQGSGVPAEALSASARSARYWSLLSRIRGDEIAESGQRPRTRESREQLLQRLVDPTLTLEETALILEVCPTTVRRYTNKGLLRHFRTQGNQRRFRFSDVVEFLESRAAEVEADSRADREAGLQ